MIDGERVDELIKNVEELTEAVKDIAKFLSKIKTNEEGNPCITVRIVK